MPSYSGSAPIVVVGGLNDPATPFAGAEELSAQMGSNASLLTFSGEGHGQILSSSCVTDAEASVIRDLRVPAPGTVCDPDPPVARPSFWDQLPVPAGVGPLVDDPDIDLALGLLPTRFYADVWNLSGDPATVASSYQTELATLGFDVPSDPPSGLTGCCVWSRLAPDGTPVVVLIFPPEALASDPELEAAAELAPPGQGFVVVAVPADN